jgi:PhnB protein
MKSFHPYLTFDGNCEDALNFYKRCFDGNIVYIQYYDEAAAFGSEAFGSKVMHSEFEAGAVHFMACDKTSNQTLNSGTNMTLYLSFQDETKQREIFNLLSELGRIQLRLEKTIWGSTVGMLTDQFGIHWMLVCNED